MTSNTISSVSSFQLFTQQFNELKEIKNDLNKLKDECITTQNKYQQRLTDYETKLEQFHSQTNKVHQEHEESETNLSNAKVEWLEIKSKLESSVKPVNDRVTLNVGGSRFETTIQTLTKHTEKTISYFKSLFSRQWQLEIDPKDGSIFIDRDGVLFNFILQYLRTNQLNIDPNDKLFIKDLLVEAQFYGFDGLVQQLQKSSVSPSSSIVVEKILYSDSIILSVEHQKQLNKLFGKNDQQWKLVYRASRDGFTAKSFHTLCDNRGPTMTVIRSKNRYIFGGFTTVPWTSSGGDKADPSAFLFTLNNPFGIQPTKYSIRKKSTQFAVVHQPTNGPTFGSCNNGGSDIYVCNPFNTANSRIFFSKTYEDTIGKGRTSFTGDSHFSCDDVEVFVRLSEENTLYLISTSSSAISI